MSLAPNLLLMALLFAALGLMGLKSGTMPIRGIPIRRAEYPRLFALWAALFGGLALACIAGAIYASLQTI